MNPFEAAVAVFPLLFVTVFFLKITFDMGFWDLPRIRKPKPAPYEAKWWAGDMFLRDRLRSFWESTDA